MAGFAFSGGSFKWLFHSLCLLNLPLVGPYSCAVGEEQKNQKTPIPPRDLSLSPPKPLSQPHNVMVDAALENFSIDSHKLAWSWSRTAYFRHHKDDCRCFERMALNFFQGSHIQEVTLLAYKGLEWLAERAL